MFSCKFCEIWQNTSRRLCLSDIHITHYFNPIQDGAFRACSRMARGGGWGEKATLPKICHTYPTKIKLGSYTLPKEDPKNMWITRQTPWVLLRAAPFHWNSANFAKKMQIQIAFWYIISKSFSFFWVFKKSFKIFLITWLRFWWCQQNNFAILNCLL